MRLVPSAGRLAFFPGENAIFNRLVADGGSAAIPIHTTREIRRGKI